MGMIDKLGGPTPDGAGWLWLHGIELGGLGVTVTEEPGKVVLERRRSGGQVAAVLVASIFGLGVASFGALLGVWPLIIVFGLLGVLPLMALGHQHRIEIRPGCVEIRLRNLFVLTSDELHRWDGRTHVREAPTSRRFSRWQLLLRVEGGWMVAATSSVDPASVRSLAGALHELDGTNENKRPRRTSNVL